MESMLLFLLKILAGKIQINFLYENIIPTQKYFKYKYIWEVLCGLVATLRTASVDNTFCSLSEPLHVSIHHADNVISCTRTTFKTADIYVLRCTRIILTRQHWYAIQFINITPQRNISQLGGFVTQLTVNTTVLSVSSISTSSQELLSSAS